MSPKMTKSVSVLKLCQSVWNTNQFVETVSPQMSVSILKAAVDLSKTKVYKLFKQADLNWKQFVVYWPHSEISQMR